jgi:hypothetical protein
MIYVEFTSRRPQPGLHENDEGALALESFASQLQRFHRAVQAGTSGWEAGWSDDRLILSVGRTWRLGPEPEYLTVWHAPTAGLGRLDAWDEVFRSGTADDVEKPFRELARIERAGCYDAVLPPAPQAPQPSGSANPRSRGAIYYAEFFEPVGSLDQIRSLYAERAMFHTELALVLCCVRIGKLAPDPGGLSIWTLPSYAELAKIARELDGMREPVRLVSAGVYNEIGKEIL